MIGMDQSYVRYYHEESEENRGKLLRRCIKLPLTLNIILGLEIEFLIQDIVL